MPPIIEVKKLFKVAVENGNKVIQIEPGTHDVSDRIAEIAINQLLVAELVQENDSPEPEPEPEQTKPKPEQTKPKPRTKGKSNDAVSDSGTSEVES